jgi:hypothetical protein
MDRHDLRGLKTGDVAEAHRRDVDIQDRHGVKYMAYWFDENNGADFCLVHAPDPETAERVHRAAHGEIPNAIIPVDHPVGPSRPYQRSERGPGRSSPP